MDKPISIALDDFKTAVVNAINESKLPAFIIEPVLGGIYRQIADMAAAQLKDDKEKYKEEDDNGVSA